ncbi:MAG: 4'-phosphopantetheinyl transferase superfamily protein [Oscillospiraceae bacterium]|nr:4'-phosphopantetheinyl transferase superfamily protein [Oscillospiraceae bacterium]
MHWSYCDVGRFSAEALERIYTNLSPSRKEHIDRLRRPEDKTRSLAAEGLLQTLLREHYGITNAKLHRASNGRPYLANSHLHISLSHSDQMVACAVSEDPVGIDIEKIRPMSLKICRHLCVEEEKAYLLSDSGLTENDECQDPEVLRRLFEIWTAKEAYFKKQGTGITDLKSVNVLHLERETHNLENYILTII